MNVCVAGWILLVRGAASAITLDSRCVEWIGRARRSETKSSVPQREAPGTGASLGENMATLASQFDRYTTAERSEPACARSRVLETEDSFAIPVFPNEDVCFRVKRIDNSRVVRTADPAARKTCWKMIGYSFVLAMLVISLLLPTLYDLMAGYRVEALRKEKERLQLDRAALELEETKLISPARLAELARIQRFVDPAPENVVYLDTKSDTILAKSDPALTKPGSTLTNK